MAELEFSISSNIDCSELRSEDTSSTSAAFISGDKPASLQTICAYIFPILNRPASVRANLYQILAIVDANQMYQFAWY